MMQDSNSSLSQDQQVSEEESVKSYTEDLEELS